MEYQSNCSVSNEFTDLGSRCIGDIVRIGERSYLIVDKVENGACLLITTEPVTKMAFGKTRNFLNSEIKAFCDNNFTVEYLKDVCSAPLLVTDLQADDGTYFCDAENKECINCSAVASIPSTNFYRRYRKVLSSIKFDRAFTATAVTATDVCDAICAIEPCGILGWFSCDQEASVYCIVCAFAHTKVQVVKQ